MPSIDERVVAMSFENQVFEQRVAQTMSTLTKLDASIKTIGNTQGLENIEKSANKVTLQQPMSALDKLRSRLSRSGEGAAQGLGEIEKAGNKVTLAGPNQAVDHLQSKMGQLSAGTTFTDIERAADRTDLSGLSKALDSVTNRFSILQGAASVALGNIASQAAMKGAAFGKSFAFGPITDGLHEYATNLNSIQTILANTQGQQVSGLGEVNKHLNELNHYSDKTIYNFSEMAKNIGTFTAAGVDLDTSTQSIKGIANLAALSGSNSQQASTAMYQLSQAIAAGRVGLQDWNSVVNAGMGGAVFQKALMRTAESMGTVAKGAVQIDKATGKATVNGESFRNSIMAAPGKESWLTSDVLTKTLGQFTGDLTDAQLAAQGFNAEQIKTIQATAKSAGDAATQVKTLPQVFDVARETIGSGWAKTFQLILGNFNQAKGTFTELSNTINGFINRTSNARNALLQTFDKLGGRDKLINALKTAFSALVNAIRPIQQAFKTIFPPTTAKDLINFVDGFQNLADAIKQFFIQHGGDIQATFEGIFAVLHIGVTIIKDVVGLFGHLFGTVAQGSGGFLSLTATIGKFLVAVDAALTKGGGLKAVFDTLGSALEVPIKLFSILSGQVISLFNGGGGPNAQAFAKGLDTVTASSKPLANAMHFLSDEWGKLMGIIDTVKAKIEPALKTVGTLFSNFGHIVADGLSNVDWNTTFGAVQTGLLAGLFLAIRKALGNVGQTLGGGALQSLSGVFKALTGNLQVMQQNVKANILIKIAAAIGILAAAVAVLSQIDSKALQRGMTALAVGMGEMVGALTILSKSTKGLGFASMPVLAASLVALSVAVLIMAGAMKVFATMDWNGIAKGLVGLGGALAAVGLGVKLIGPRIVPAALAMIPLAIGLNLLALAVRQFGSMDLGTLGKGLGAVAVSLGLIAAAMAFMPVTMPLIGAGLIAVGFGLTTVAASVASFGNMNLKTLVQGLLGTAGAIVAIGMAVALIPPNLALQAAGLAILGVALIEIGTAVGIIGRMKVATLVKGIAALGAVLVELSIGLILMEGTLPGAAALLVVAAALAILGPAIGFMGQLDFGTVIKGLAGLALVFGVLALAGTLLAAPLAALGTALLPLMADLAIAAAAAVAFGFALKLMGDNGVKAVAATVAAILLFVSSLPKIVIQFLQGMVGMAQEVAKVAPMILAALGKLIAQVVDFVIAEAPKLAVAIGVLIGQFVTIVNQNAPKIIAAGLKLLTDFLGGVANNIGKVTGQVASIITHFLDALAKNLPRIVRSGVNTLVSFLNGIATNLGRVLGTAAAVVGKFIEGITKELPGVITKGVRLMVVFLNGIASKVGDVIKAGVNLIVAVIKGIGDALPRIAKAGVQLIGKFINAVAGAAVGLAKTGYHAIINFLNGLAKAIRDNNQALIDAGFNLADAIIDGMVNGFKQLGHKAIDAVGGLIKKLPGAAKKLLGIHSPSKVFHEIGTNVMLGLINGLLEKSPAVLATVGNALKGMVDETGDAKKLGRFLGNDFMDGLTGAMDNRSAAHQRIDTAFANLKSQMHDQIGKIKDQLAKDKQKWKDEWAKDHPSVTVLASINRDIQSNTSLLAKSKKAMDNLMGSLVGEKKQLVSLAASYDSVTARLADAQSALDKITQDRDQFQAGLVTQYDALPDIDAEQTNQVAAYKKALQDKITATEKYMATLQQLRALGLDDTTYRKLLAEGSQDQGFATQLVAQGKGAVDDINKLDAQLAADAGQLAQDAATNLYKAGVDAAQGLVDGLKQRQADIQGQMDEIAAAMVRSIKKKLGIRSPSRVMAQIGQYTAQGVIDGLNSTSQAVANAAAGIGDDAASAMSGSLSHISDVLNSEIDPNLTITPVLDLTQVQKDAQKLSDLTNVTPITAAASYGQASAASQEVSASQTAAAEAVASAAPTIEFTQNNTSPESLSEVEIYRQTRNGLAQVKKLVGVTP